MTSDQVNTMDRDTKGAAESVEIVFEQQKKTADGEIVLIPQPSDDPRDPLVSKLYNSGGYVDEVTL
jgi:hypothetical protein